MWKRITTLWVLLRSDAKILWFALLHPEAPGWLKAGTAGVVLYLLSPIDLIPDFIPVLGVVDDIILVPAAIRWLLRQLPAHIRSHAERRANGQPGDTGPAKKQASVVIDEVR
jgi:uncharacterized membrane protein YkvA (DUF1232 family)